MKPLKASTFYLANTAAIAATTTYPIQSTISNRDFDDYGPFNHFIVQNNSGQPVNIYVDGDTNRGYRAESGATILTDADDNIFFKYLSIYNAGGAAIAIGDIIVTIVRKIPKMAVI